LASKEFESFIKQCKQDVDKYLESLFGSKQESPLDFYRSMAYSLLSEGKRLRPTLCLATVKACGGKPKDALPVAAAIEMVHTFTLVHDDLPALDNSKVRRGKPTNHTVFGEGVALLAANAILIEAFQRLSSPQFSKQVGAARSLRMLQELASMIGSAGSMKGQAMELELRDNKDTNRAQLEYIYIHKTGKLILASILLGAYFAKAKPKQIKALTHYGEAIGVAFAITNDLLDVEGEGVQASTNPWKDTSEYKVGYPSLAGVSDSRRRVEQLVAKAQSALESFDKNADPLRVMARHMVKF